MKRLLQAALLVTLGAGLIGCGPARKSVYPPDVRIQQLSVLPNGQWQLTLRIQNNSYAAMDFSALNGQLQIGQLLPVRLHATFQRDIPALNGDVVQLQLLPTAEMIQAEKTVAAKGSSGSLAYRLSGDARATPELEDTPRDFHFSGTDWISPVPGIPHTWR